MSDLTKEQIELRKIAFAMCETCLIADALKACDHCLFDIGGQIAQEYGYRFPLVIEPCKHERGTVYNHRTYSATLHQTEETTGSVTCDDCGAEFVLHYCPDGMRLYTPNGKEW